MKCKNCDWEGFNEDGGFYFCQRCHQQYEGVQVQIADDDHVRSNTGREVAKRRGKQSGSKRTSKAGRQKERTLFSKYTDIEFQVICYIGIVEDFAAICRQLNPDFDSVNFIKYCYRLMIKYLRESEIAFARNENKDSVVKMYPIRRYRDKVLINNNVEDLEHVPFLRRIQPKKDDNHSRKIVSRTYRPANRGTGLQNFDYYDSQERFKDSRLSIYNFKEECKIDRTFDRDNYRKILKEIDDDEEDELVKIIDEAKQRMTEDSLGTETLASENVDKEDSRILNDDNEENVEGEYGNKDDERGRKRQRSQQPEDDEEVNEEEREKNESELILSQMPKRLRKLCGDKSIDYFKKGWKNTLKTIDVLDQKKLICLLYIGIRKWNIGVFFGDLVQWINCDLIRLRFAWDYLPRNYEILNRRSNIYFRVGPTLSLLDNWNVNMSIHMQIDGHENIADTVILYVERILYDLNLPKGLKLLIKLNYDDFIERVYMEKYCSKGFIPPRYEHLAWTLIVLTLRDLFGLDKRDQNWKIPNMIDNLFDLKQWYIWSMIRINAIKANICDLPVLNNNEIVDALEVQHSYRKEYDYTIRHKDQYTTANYAIKLRDPESRKQLREQYEFVFADDDYDRIELSLKRKRNVETNLSQLTWYTDYLRNKCNNQYLSDVLKTDFGSTLITPYYHWNVDEFGRFGKEWLPSGNSLAGVKFFNKWLATQHTIVQHLFNDLAPFVLQNTMASDLHSFTYFRAVDSLREYNESSEKENSSEESSKKKKKKKTNDRQNSSGTMKRKKVTKN